MSGSAIRIGLLAYGVWLTVTVCAHAQAPLLINYQGRLVDGTNLVNGPVGLTLQLYNVSSGGTPLYADSNTVTVVDGLYSTFLGDNTISGNLVAALTNFSVWLEAVVNGTPLTPREQVASVGYALSVRGMQVTTNNNIMMLPNLNSMDAGTSWAAIGGGSDNHISNAANYAVVAGGVQNRISAQAQQSVISGGGFNSIGTNAAQSVISGGAQNRIGPVSQYAVIAGGNNNVLGTNVLSGTISGGGNHVVESGVTTPTISGGLANRIDGNANFAVIAGGHNNRISTNASGAVISGGDGNRIWQSSSQSVIAGGRENSIAFFTEHATIGGGRDNEVGWNSDYAVIGGGLNNDLGVEAQYTVIAGGQHNFALNSASNAFIGGGVSNRVARFGMIPGGQNNFADAYSFAAGRRARAVHSGSFVWGDNTDADITTTADRQFLIRAGGGMGVNVPSIGSGVTADFGDRLRVRGSTAGIWMYDTALSSDRGFVGLSSANHIGFYGHHGA
ncbi:MAG TPA: hypothetical protein PKE26_11510, partial [Kiritimatiellia bacterium]|nr:hypothetical protein [Kiritimatiellia bacterium]HMO99728.1 hypothetical protein [Kiritimatiellia bacterium]HMP97427.1 hypothetical protein [Kiritimatiellia bacterium]